MQRPFFFNWSKILSFLMATVFWLEMGYGQNPPSEEALKKLYLDYRKAIQDGSLEKLNEYLTAESARELTAPGAQEKLQLLKGFMPKEVEIMTVTISGDTAKLDVRATMEGQSMTGTVQMLKEGQKWKLSKEDWEMKITLSDLPVEQGAPSGSLPTRPLFQDPAQPPQPHLILKGHQGEVTSLVFTPDNRYLISVSYGDYSIRVWEALTGKETSNVKSENRFTCLALTADGKTVVTDDAYQHILLWPIHNGVLGQPRQLLEGFGEEFAINRDGSLIAVTGYRKPVRIHNFKDGILVRELPDTLGDRKLAFSPSGKLLVTGGGNKITLWETQHWKATTYTLQKVQEGMDVGALRFSPDERYIGIGHMDSSILIFGLKTRKELHNFFVRDASTWDLQFSPERIFFATAQQDKALYLWDIQTASQKAVLKKHKDSIRCIAFSPDGRTLASGSQDRTIILWRGGAPAEPIQEEESKKTPFQPDPQAKPEVMELWGRRNFLQNPHANQHEQFWKVQGETSISEKGPGDPCFSVRYDGFFFQDAAIPESTGKYALLIGRVSSERINEDGDITGLPYLYGYMLDAKDNHRIHAYLQGETMRCQARSKNEWVPVWGIFKVPNETGKIRLFLQQASGRDAQNGSAARFDDLGIFILDTELEAKAFAEKYRNSFQEQPVLKSEKTTESIPSEPAAQMGAIPPEFFKITGVMGEVGTADVTVTINGNILVRPGETFNLEYQGQSHVLKLISISANHMILESQAGKIQVPYSADD